MSVTLIYGPKLVESCDAIWTANTNVTASIETTIKKSGSGSAKLAVASGFTTGVAAYKAIASLDMTKATQIRFWIRSSINISANHLQFLIDNTAACASPLELLDIGALTADTWSQQTLSFATPANLTAVIALGLKVVTDNGACNIYIDKIELVSETRTFNELHIVGFDNPENEDGFPQSEAVQLLDGSWYKDSPVVSTRNIYLDLGVIQDIQEQIFLRNFAWGESQSITYAGETVSVISTMNSFPVSRANNTKTSKSFRFELKEKTARALNVLPSSWV